MKSGKKAKQATYSTFNSQTSFEMDQSLDEDPNWGADNNDMLKAAGCLLASAAVQKAVTKCRERRKRRSRKRRSIWVREWLLMRPKYGMYEKLMKHLRESDEKFF